LFDFDTHRWGIRPDHSAGHRAALPAHPEPSRTTDISAMSVVRDGTQDASRHGWRPGGDRACAL